MRGEGFTVCTSVDNARQMVGQRRDEQGLLLPVLVVRELLELGDFRLRWANRALMVVAVYAALQLLRLAWWLVHAP